MARNGPNGSEVCRVIDWPAIRSTPAVAKAGSVAASNITGMPGVQSHAAASASRPPPAPPPPPPKGGYRPPQQPPGERAGATPGCCGGEEFDVAEAKPL